MQGPHTQHMRSTHSNSKMSRTQIQHGHFYDENSISMKAKKKYPFVLTLKIYFLYEYSDN